MSDEAKSGTPTLYVRDACKLRHPLSGADAQALEGALCQLESELAGAKAKIAALEDEQEKHAFDLTPEMVQARNDQLNDELERAKAKLADAKNRIAYLEKQNGLLLERDAAFSSESFRAEDDWAEINKKMAEANRRLDVAVNALTRIAEGNIIEEEWDEEAAQALREIGAAP